MGVRVVRKNARQGILRRQAQVARHIAPGLRVAPIVRQRQRCHQRPQHQRAQRRHHQQRRPDAKEPRHHKLRHIALVQQAVGHHQPAQKKEQLYGQRARIVVAQQTRQHIAMPLLWRYCIGMAIDHQGSSDQPKNVQIVVVPLQQIRQSHAPASVRAHTPIPRAATPAATAPASKI